MAVEKHKLMSLCRELCARVPERYSGYRGKLGGVIEDIYWAEREHSIKRINIREKSREICESLGDELFEASSE